MHQIGMERCPCGHKGCRDFHLTGIGKFVQESGFTEEEATALIAAYNARGWRPIDDGAKGGKGKPVIIAVRTWRGDHTVGEAWWDAGLGEFWWAGTSPGDYHADSVTEMTGTPEFYQPLPEPPDEAPQQPTTADAAETLRAIHRVMDVKEWSPDTLDAIASILASAGLGLSGGNS